MYSPIIVISIFLGLSLASPVTPDEPEVKFRSVNGNLATIEEFPFLVSVQLDSSHNCGGTIITPFHILTAAHCFKYDKNPSSYQVRAGSSLENYGGSLHKVQQIIIHPGYSFTSLMLPYNDLAIVVLDTENPIEINGVSTKVASFFESNVQNGSIALAAGWGRMSWDGESPEQLLKVQLSMVDTNKCRDEFVVFDSDKPRWDYICATDYSTKNNQSLCQGDSGGPLIVDGRLAGVASRAIECSSSPIPNLFAGIEFNRKWIDEHVIYQGNLSEDVHKFLVKNFVARVKKTSEQPLKIINNIIDSINKKFEELIKKVVIKEQERLRTHYGDIKENCIDLIMEAKETGLKKEETYRRVKKNIIEPLAKNNVNFSDEYTDMIKKLHDLPYEVEFLCLQGDSSCQMGVIHSRMNEFDVIFSKAMRTMKELNLAMKEQSLFTIVRKNFVVYGQNYCVKTNNSQ